MSLYNIIHIAFDFLVNSAIKEMERGKLCPMQQGRYFNLQSWENGKNQVRYIPPSQAKAVAKAIKG